MSRNVVVGATVAAVFHVVLAAQQVGPNVNVLAGTDPRTGDAFLQRQNEPSGAISTRNPDHLIFAFNDYRTVDIALDTTEPDAIVFARNERKPKQGVISTESVRAQTPPEAWIGLAFSRDRGRTFYNALLPGYPQDPTAVGQASPVYGDSAGSDPVLINGQNGRVYLIALTFDRGGVSRISSTRYTDRNNVEGGEPFYFDFTRQIDKGSLSSKGRFGDKPSGAAFAGSGSTVFATSGVSKKKRQIVVVPGCERLYTAYTVFDGNEVNGNFKSSIYASVSASCGDTWSAPVKISGPYTANGVNYPGTRNQGTATAVDPDTGNVYIAWRTYGPNGMVYVRSTDGGLTFSAPKSITPAVIYPFDQPSLKTTDGANVVTFRSNAYPSLLVYDGKPVVVWSERIDLGSGASAANGAPRVVMSVGTPAADGSVSWSARRPIDLGDQGAATPNTRCEQVIPDSGVPTPVTECRTTGAQVMPYIVGRDGQITAVFYEARSDAQAPGGITPGTTYISGLQRQVDVRAALLGPPAANPASSDIATWPTAASFQISRYQIDSATGRIRQNANAPYPELRKRVNYANFPMYLGGLAPFIGDYIHATQLRPDGSGPGYRVAFTSNEFVDPPPDADFTRYSKPQSGVLSSCNPGSRNSTIVTAEVGTGLVTGSPGTFKQLVNAQGQPVQRAFAVYVENHTPAYRAFQLSFANVSPGVVASFEQFATVPTVAVEVLASSSVTRTVYLTGNVATGSVVVNAAEIQLPDPPGLHAAVSLNLHASVTLNGDGTNPFVGFAGNGGNPGLENTETHTPQIESPQLGSPQLGSPQIGSPQLGSPQLESPQIESPQLGSPQISSPQIESTGPTDPYTTDITVKVTNDGNTASAYNSLVSLANAPHLQATGHSFQVIVYRVHQSATVNGCNVGKAQKDQVVYQTPQLGSPQLGNPQLGSPQIGSPQLGSPQLGSPQLGSPQLGSPQLGSPQLASASFSVSPADPTPDAHDGTEHEHQANDALMLTVRVRHPLTETLSADGTHLVEHPDVVQEFTNAFAIAVEAQAADTGETAPAAAFFDTVAPNTTILVAPPAQMLNSTATISFAGTDNLSPAGSLRFTCSIDGGASSPCASPFTTPVLIPGSHTFSVAAIDESNNTDATPATATWTMLAYGTADLVVADGAKLDRYSAAGAFLGTIGTLPSGSCAQGFDIAANGDYYIADACSPGVWKMTPGGAVTSVYAGAPLANPVAIAIDLVTGNLIVADNDTDTLYTVTPAGAISTLAALPGPSPTLLEDIDIRRGRFGSFFVAYDEYNDVAARSAVISVTPGGVVTPVVSNLAVPASIGGMAINGSGDFIIGDFRGSRIVQITASGNVTTLRSDPALNGNLSAIEGDTTRGPLFGVINGVNGGAPRLVRIDIATGVTVLNTNNPIAAPNAIRFLVLPEVPPAGVTGPLDVAGPGNVNTVVGTWTERVSRDFALQIDLGQKTVSLQIDGVAVPGAQNLPFFDATATDIARVGMELGTIGTQKLGWDDVAVRNADPDLGPIFSADFTNDAVNAAPAVPAVGTWTIANANGSVLVQSAFGNLANKPVVLSQFGGTNSVSLSGLVTATPPTSGVWTVRWKSAIDPGTSGPFTAIAVRDSNSRLITAIEYR